MGSNEAREKVQRENEICVARMQYIRSVTEHAVGNWLVINTLDSGVPGRMWHALEDKDQMVLADGFNALDEAGWIFVQAIGQSSSTLIFRKKDEEQHFELVRR